MRNKLIKSINKTVDEHQCLGAENIADGILEDIPEINDIFKFAEWISNNNYECCLKNSYDCCSKGEWIVRKNPYRTIAKSTKGLYALYKKSLKK